MNLSKEESNFINFLKIILILGVVLTHTAIVVPLPHDYTNTTYNFIYFQQEVLGEFRVPTFFLISGYFFYKTNIVNISTYKSKIKSKLSTLLVPYIIWSIIAIILHIIYDLIKHHDSSLFSLKTFFKSFLFYNGDIVHQFPINGPLWYIRDLILIIIFLSPFISNIIARYKNHQIIILNLTLFILLPYIQAPFSFLITGFIWFTIGASISLNNISFSVQLEKFNLVFLIYPICVIFHVISRNMIMHELITQITIIFGIFFNAKLWWYIYRKYIKSNMNYNSYVMFIYCSHFITDYIKPICNIFFPQKNLIIQYIMVSIITITICSASYVLLYKFNKKILNILVGNRK